MVSNVFPAFLTTDNLVHVGIALVIVAVTFVLDKLIRRAISRYGKRVNMDLMRSTS